MLANFSRTCFRIQSMRFQWVLGVSFKLEIARPMTGTLQIQRIGQKHTQSQFLQTKSGCISDYSKGHRAMFSFFIFILNTIWTFGEPRGLVSEPSTESSK